ncbi:MAG TPA: TolC family protein [Sphingobacteriaceae bacterium]
MKYRLYILFLLLSASGAAAQERDSLKYTFTLNEAINYALDHQTSVLNAKIDEEIAQNTVKQTVGIGLPRVSSTFDFSDYLKVPTSLLPGEIFGQPGTQIPVQFGVKYQSSAGVRLDQLLFDGTYIVGLQASKTYKELSTRNSKRSRIETAVAVTKAYYSVLVSNEQFSLIDANLTQLKKSLNDTEALFKNGFVEKIDVDRLQVLKNNLETERENVTRLLALNLEVLKFQMGMPVDGQLILEDSIATVQPEATSLVADTTAYRSRIEYSLLETQKKLNLLDLKRYKSQFLPSISGFASASKSFQSNSFSQLYERSFPTSVIGLSLSWNIINGGQRLYQMKNAKLEVQKTENDLMNLQNAINLEISQTQKNYSNSLQSLENQKRNLNLAQEILRVTRIKYEQGVGSSLEVTSAETSLKEAQNNYINSLYDLLINKVNLDKSLGKINY